MPLERRDLDDLEAAANASGGALEAIVMALPLAERIARAVERIADALEALAEPAVMDKPHSVKVEP
jgi:hypothetical protein